MDTILIIIGVIFLIGGLIGCITPFPPGPPLAYCSLILLQFTRYRPFSSSFLIVWAIIIILITWLDYYVAIQGTKKFGGTKGGAWGATTGLIAGLFFTPIGLLPGLLLGAFIGELLNRQNTRTAFRSAIGSFIGFLAGAFMKLIVCLVIAFYFIKGILY
jgi:uncharacterized protein YqgC (DUF456 family)